MKDLRRLQRLLPYLARDRRRLFLAISLLLPVAAASAVQPLLVGQAISVLRGEQAWWWLQAMPMASALRWLIGLLLIAVLVRLALQGSQSLLVQTIGQRLTSQLRVDLFSHTLNLSLRFHDRTPVGKLITRLTNDVDALAEVFGSGAIGVIADVVTFVVIASLMLSINRPLGLMLLFLQIPITWLVISLQQRYRKANYRVREELGQLNSDLQENLQGLEIVQMFRRETLNSERFAITNGKYRKAVDGTIFYDSAISALLEWISLAAVALVLAVGGHLVTSGSVGLGVLTTFILFSQRLFDPLRQLAERFTQIQAGLTAIERIGELLDTPLEIKEAKSFIPSDQPKSGEVIFEDVCFAYRDDEPILENINIHIKPGEHIALVGPTGSGKTTVIRLLCRLYEQQQGRILLDGVDIRELPIPDLRQRLGVVLQDTFLFSGSVANNLTLNSECSRHELEQLCKDLGLAPMLEKLPNGLDTSLRERGGNLSSGERQLLAIARVALRNPSVLVMDEATAFLDPSTEATLQNDLSRLLTNRTAIVIAHRLATVEASDRILVLKRGRVVEEGSHIDLRAQGGLYAQLADLQERGLATL
ncbi:ABC transporter ATP-binding protein [Synechococcus sp. UW140]|uniref:ABC transporter ATP-binding protein n=1 Tax=Synechococcus sp. UW140 TaxID=368503 RepID=UPI00313786F0